MFGWLARMLGVEERSGRAEECVTVVSGLPRSGTSLMMQMLDAGGLQPLTDEQRTRDENNPKGYYEFDRVKRLNQGDTAWVSRARGRAVKVVSELLPYLPPQYHYRVLFMRRHLQEVLDSQSRMLDDRGTGRSVEDEEMTVLYAFLRRHLPDVLGIRGTQEDMDDEEMVELYRAHLQRTLDWMQRQPNLAYIEVNFNELVEHPRPYVEKVISFLHADLDADAMVSAVDPELYRVRA